jgi:hypothetical protein
MKNGLFCMTLITSLLIGGCSYFKDPFKDPYPQLSEVQAQQVADCDMLGMVAETADADTLFPYFARREMVQRVKARASQLGATHIVWLHQTNESAAAQTYRCKP